ncbi:ApaG protein [Rhodobium orientis]|uniref:Protein ApaG n=1 Tax=Rhodobium orientis TaxID=34017 RepID=A0A327JP27_9HYPH|nr:Co2+/Mg2+ efflux protein ApaG [Rhodobium orientis]MBB4305277.1 ApaG protein [Rhodobium orientis]MBK5949613.1 Co2+/Mg2+ efflux protein ApaG [Rhodobium orientis]RAI25168.1 Co2+/Mg2+ efflux protein ApaG [Rhodobium orientis]
MYRAVTRNIQITVEPVYLDEESAPDQNRYFWAYTVEIVNLGGEPVQLRTRHWKITDATGRVQEVHGAGVVGEEPVIEPDEAYEYTSGCPLSTPGGIMAGHYQMECDDGERFDVEIPAFSLDVPDMPRVIN